MEVFKALRERLERGERSGYVKLPTGAGKTVIFSEFVEALGGRSLVVVPTNQLVEQTVERIKQFAPGMKVTSYDQNVKDLSGDAVVITYDSLLIAHSQGSIAPKNFNALILDEAHRSMGEKRSETLSQFKSQCLTIGFTATPEFNEEKSLRAHLGEPLYQMSLKEAVEGGMLCPTRWIPVKTQADVSKVKVTSSGEYDESSIEKAVNTAVINKAAAQVFKHHFASKTGVAFCCTIHHAKDSAKAFQELGISADATWGGDPQLADKLARLERGEIRMLCNAKLLIEGFDQCGISVCLNLAPTRSIVAAEQRGGRVLRLDKENPTKQGFIVDFIPSNLEVGKMPVTFAQIMGGTALGEVTPLSTESSGEGKSSDAPPMKIDGVEVILDKIAVQAFLDQSRVLSSGTAPQGWVPISELHKSFSELPASIVPTVARELISPEFIGEYVSKFVTNDGLNNIVDHVSPELIRELRESLRLVPTDWQLLLQVTFPLLDDQRTQEEFLKIAADPEFGNQIKKLAGEVIIIGPNFIAELHHRLKHADPAPEGWRPRSEIMKMYPNLPWSEIRQVIAEIIGEDGHLTRKFTDLNLRRESDFFAPEVLAQLPDAIAESQAGSQFTSKEYPGWMGTKAACALLGIERSRLSRCCDTLGEPGITFAKLHLHSGIAVYYSPQLLTEIGRELEEQRKLNQAPVIPTNIKRIEFDKCPDLDSKARGNLMAVLQAEFPKCINFDRKGFSFPAEILGSVKESLTRAVLEARDYKCWDKIKLEFPTLNDFFETAQSNFPEQGEHKPKEIIFRGQRLLFVPGYLTRPIVGRAREKEKRALVLS